MYDGASFVCLIIKSQSVVWLQHTGQYLRSRYDADHTDLPVIPDSLVMVREIAGCDEATSRSLGEDSFPNSRFMGAMALGYT